jgi:hypothetical protein
MKPHYVRLSDQAIDVLESLYEITGHGELMFPHHWDKSKMMSKNTILEALYQVKSVRCIGLIEIPREVHWIEQVNNTCSSESLCGLSERLPKRQFSG